MELLKKWKMYNVFDISLLELNITKKRQVNKNVMKLDTGNNDSKKYKREAIQNNTIYIKKSESNYLLKRYYLLT